MGGGEEVSPVSKRRRTEQGPPKPCSGDSDLSPKYSVTPTSPETADGSESCGPPVWPGLEKFQELLNPVPSVIKLLHQCPHPQPARLFDDLISAIKSKSLDMDKVVSSSGLLEKMLALGADPHFANDYCPGEGTDVLQRAIEYKLINIAKFLIKNGTQDGRSNCNSYDRCYTTTLEYAIQVPSLELVELVYEHGVAAKASREQIYRTIQDLDFECDGFEQGLHHCCCCKFSRADDQKEQKKIIGWYLHKNFSINRVEADSPFGDATPLDMAIESEQPKDFQDFLRALGARRQCEIESAFSF